MSSFPKELFPYITTEASFVAGFLPNPQLVRAANPNVERWLVMPFVCGSESVVQQVELRTLGGVLLYTWTLFQLPQPKLFLRRLTQADNGLQLIPIINGLDVAWTIVFADAPANILSGANALINARQGWGASHE